jgi:hypothetical protein
MELLTEVRWTPYAVGIGIGILSWFSFLISREPISCSTSLVLARAGQAGAPAVMESAVLCSLQFQAGFPQSVFSLAAF